MSWPIHLRRVSGVSLMPAIRPGQVLVFVRRRRIRPSQLVLARVDNLEVVKRVSRRQGDSYRLVGSWAGAASYRVPGAAILGVAVRFGASRRKRRL